jgi:tetratricopeptide (TPR) repeat protein
VRLAVFVPLLIVLAPATASAACGVVDTAPLVFPDQRSCLPVDDKGLFLRSTGGVPWIAHLGHGYACLGEGRYRLAAAEFATAHRQNPRDVRSVMYEAVAYDRLNEPAQVAKLVALARRTAPYADPPMRPDTIPGATQLMNGHYAEAFAHWSDLAEHPYNAPIYEDAHAIQPYRDGLKLAVRGAYCDALRVLAPAVAGNASFGDIRFVMGASYYALGNRAAARYEWDAAAIQTPPQPGYWVAGPIQWTALNLLAQTAR